MAGDTDFIALYRELGLESDCSLEAFRQAYRKRVGMLHPDRRHAPEAPTELQRLNALYASAREFQRRHGRLPGATPAAASVAVPEAGHGRATPGPAVDGPPESRSNPKAPLAIFTCLLAALWIAALLAPAENAAVPPARSSVGSVARESPGQRPMPHLIALGTAARQVRAILGEPVSGWEQRWEYGPSWIAFRCGVVTDWYSSPLRPLKVASDHPPATTTWSPPKNCKD